MNQFIKKLFGIISHICKSQNKIIEIISIYYNRQSKRNLCKNAMLLTDLTKYLKKTNSTGCSYADYWELYNYIREKKPSEILECGTGVSTIIMAHALLENERETGIVGRITSMEDIEKWYEAAIKILPEHLSKYVDLVHSVRIENYYSIYRGVCYKDVPKRPYDFVFIDGPGTKAPSDGDKTFDMDFINVVRNSDKTVSAIIDKRLSTCYVFQKIFGDDKVKYVPYKGLGYVKQCTKSDLKVVGLAKDFESCFKAFGKTKLHLTMIKK